MNSRIVKITSLLLLILLMTGIAVAATPALAEAVAVTKPKSVALDQKGTIKVPLGTTLTLNATLSPEGAQSTLKWSSSKKKIASVSGGVVTAKKVGTATITVTTANKKKAKVKVKVYDPTKPTSVRFSVSGTQTLMVMNKLQLNAVMSPETAQSTIKWKSSNKKVATVNSSGVVTGIMPGKTTITATTTRNKKTAKIKIKVIDDGKQPITTLPDYNLPYVIYACKNSHTIAVIARDETGAWTRVLRTWPTGTGRSSSTTDVGTFFLSKKERWHKWGSGYSPYANRVSVGIYLHGPIFKSKNTNSIRPSYYNCIGTNCSSGCLRTVTACAGWIYYNCPVGTQIIVAQNSRFSAPRPTKISKNAKKDPTDPGTFEILMTGFSVTPGAMTLDPGAAQGITPSGFTPAATTTSTFTFASRNPAVATVSAAGIVTGVGAGSTEILVTANDDFRCTAVVPVTVNAAVETAPKLAEAAEAEELPEDFIVEEAEPEVVADTPADEAVIVETPEAETLEEGSEAEAADEADTGDADFFFDETEAVSEDLSQVLVAAE